jgi:hypothetical protein
VRDLGVHPRLAARVEADARRKLARFVEGHVAHDPRHLREQELVLALDLAPPLCVRASVWGDGGAAATQP